MAVQVKPLLDIYAKYLGKRRQWEGIWDDLARYEFPRRMFHLGLRSEGEQQTDDLFDSTAVFSAEVLMASLQSGLTNQAIKWFNLKLDEELMQDDDVRLWLENTTLQMLGAFASSNFNTESSEMYLDLGVFGIGAIFVGENEGAPPISGNNNFRGLRFEALPIGSYVVDEDGHGRVNTLFHRVRMSAAAVVERWGVDRVSEDVRKLARENPAQDVALLHAVLPKQRVPGTVVTMPVASIWIEEKTKHVMSEGGFREFPYAVPRWSKAAGESYGRGPGFTVLPDVKTLNRTIELFLKAMEVAVQPPIKARQNSVIGSVDFSPGGLTVVRNMEDLDEFVTRANFQAAGLEINDLRQSIRRGFFVDQLLQLLAREAPMMTATEVVAKMQLLREIVGPAFNRLESEFLEPMIDRVFNLMLRSGAILDPPEALSGMKINVDYESPIGLAKRGQELTAIDRVLLRAQEMAAMGKVDVLDNLDDDEILRITARIAGAPETILRNSELRDALRRQRKDAEAAAMALQQGSEAARNIAPLAKVVQEASPPEGSV